MLKWEYHQMHKGKKKAQRLYPNPLDENYSQRKCIKYHAPSRGNGNLSTNNRVDD